MSATPPGPPASYWRQRAVFVPFTPPANLAAGWGNRYERVELLGCRSGVGDWRVLQQAEVTVRGFNFQAPADGAYDFAVRLIDRRGNAWPQGVIQPQARVVIDSRRPELRLAATCDGAGRLTVRYEAHDAALHQDSLRIEVREDGQPWRPLALSPSQAGDATTAKLVGSWTGKVGDGSKPLEIRALAADRAGNRAMQAGRVGADVASPLQQQLASASAAGAAGPQLGGAGGGATLTLRPATGSRGAAEPTAADILPREAETAPAGPSLTAAQSSGPVLGDGRHVSDPFAGPPPSPAGADSDLAPPLLDPNRGPFRQAATSFGGMGGRTKTPPARASDWRPQPTAEVATQGGRWVNSNKFELEYDLQTVGPWGVAAVELWSTRDGGKTWTLMGADPDQRSPAEAAVPAPGVYGFRIVVDGAHGEPAPRPAAGDAPDAVVVVDLSPPTGEIRSAQLGTEAEAGQLLIEWTGADDHLEPRPASLAYADRAEGPWRPIATNLPASGRYRWEFPRNVPRQLYLRLELRDLAGNVTCRELASPVLMAPPSPQGRIRGIRAAAGLDSQ